MKKIALLAFVATGFLSLTGCDMFKDSNKNESNNGPYNPGKTTIVTKEELKISLLSLGQSAVNPYDSDHIQGKVTADVTQTDGERKIVTNLKLDYKTFGGELRINSKTNNKLVQGKEVLYTSNVDAKLYIKASVGQPLAAYLEKVTKNEGDGSNSETSSKHFGIANENSQSAALIDGLMQSTYSQISALIPNVLSSLIADMDETAFKFAYDDNGKNTVFGISANSKQQSMKFTYKDKQFKEVVVYQNGPSFAGPMKANVKITMDGYNGKIDTMKHDPSAKIQEFDQVVLETFSSTNDQQVR